MKLYPLYIIMLLADIIILKDEIYLNVLASNLFLYQSWIPNGGYYYGYNGVSWYISTSILAWCISPYIYKIINKCFPTKYKSIIAIIGNLMLLATICFVGKIVYPFTGDNNQYHIIVWVTYVCPLTRLIDFTCGMLLASVCNKAQICDLKKNRIIISILEILGVILTCVVVKIDDEAILPLGDWWYKLSLIMLPLTVTQVYLCGLERGITRFLNNKVIQSIAKYSPYIFLIHQVVERTLRMYIPFFDWKNFGWLFVVTLVISYILSYLYWKEYENIKKHLKKWRRSDADFD